MQAHTRLRVLVVFACSLFIISIFSPFLTATWYGLTIPEWRPGPETFWSFKKREVSWSLMHGLVIREWWFADYWWQASQRTDQLWLRIGPFLIFVAQVFTVLFVALAIFKVKPYLLLLSTIFNSFTTFWMWSISNALGSYYQKQFEAGFWLSLISAALFLIAFILSLRVASKMTP